MSFLAMITNINLNCWVKQDYICCSSSHSYNTVTSAENYMFNTACLCLAPISFADVQFL